MNNETITLIVAIIGAICGVLSLLLHFYDYKRNNPKVKVKFNNIVKYINGRPIKKNHASVYDGNYLVFRIIIDNVSNVPISIKSIGFHNFFQYAELIKAGVYDGYEMYDGTEIKLPYCIDPRCSIFSFYIFKVDYNSYGPDKICIKLTFNHTKKYFYARVHKTKGFHDFYQFLYKLTQE